ncbi:MAG: alpha-amylase family glycosyl hydrolase [Candidatus Limnocylindrales bacterium]
MAASDLARVRGRVRDPGGERGSWWRHGVFYQIYPRSFQDSDGDGVGDLPGITARLNHLNDGTPGSLGIDAIWISPFYRSPMADFGYDVADYRDVDPRFGTLHDFDELLGQAHQRGIRVIVDLVPNHTSDQHPWFQEARSSLHNPKRDWYVWADPKPDGSPPNGWRSVFKPVGPAWTLDKATGQYYLHLFLPQQPDLNWWNPEVRTAMDEVMRFWLDRGADGFRVDVAAALVHDPRLREEPTASGARRRWPRYWGLPDVHEIHRHWRKLLDASGDHMAVGEVSNDPARRLVRYYGRNDELHLSFYFHFMQQPWKAGAFRRAVAEFEGALPEGTWPNYTLSNHDRPRAASRYGPGSARVAMMMLLTLRGTPFIYYGEEIAMTDVPVPADRVVDVDGRDPERTPMQWDSSDGAGFTSGSPWLPIGPDSGTVNVERQRDDPASMLSFTRRLSWFRRSSAALRWGRFQAIGSSRTVFAFLREAPGERLLIALNFSETPRRLRLGSLAATEPARLELSTDPARRPGAVDLRRLELGSNEGVVVRLRQRGNRWTTDR